LEPSIDWISSEVVVVSSRPCQDDTPYQRNSGLSILTNDVPRQTHVNLRKNC